jgi:hypothetical protein
MLMVANVKQKSILSENLRKILKLKNQEKSFNFALIWLFFYPLVGIKEKI